MKRPLNVRLSEFAVEALARGESRDSEEVRGRFARAVRFYLHESGAQRPGWSVPSGLRRDEPKDVEVALDVDDELWRALEAEAGRQDVTLSRLVSQAVIYYAAELDAGRITLRVIDDLESRD